MSVRKGVPDPRDTTDPRVAQEWVNRLGQEIILGDFVTFGRYGSRVGIGKVVAIFLTRQDGRPFSNDKPHLQLQSVDDQWVPETRKIKSQWNNETKSYEDVNLVVPVTTISRNPDQEIIKVEAR